MAGRSYDQRYKIILVLRILLKYSDEDHPLKLFDIQGKLLDYGIYADVHSIGRYKRIATTLS